jgi:4-hydroxy-3-methylbut-2-enyl diphosphate reductase
MIIRHDRWSGFCFGVQKAIEMAEEELAKTGSCYALGSLVHNPAEEQRLRELGLKTITQSELSLLNPAKVLFRAHGEPPSTYGLMQRKGIKLLDGTCPIVLKLQKKVAQHWELMKKVEGQIAIFGKPGHAETIGLNGQVENKAVIIAELKDASLLDYEKPLTLFSQTTMSEEKYAHLIEIIKDNYRAKGMPDTLFTPVYSICKQVSGRLPKLAQFAKEVDVLLFVSGKSSSNGKVLYAYALKNNARSYQIEHAKELKADWFNACKTIGISGATSTPQWQLDEVENHLIQLLGLDKPSLDNTF